MVYLCLEGPHFEIGMVTPRDIYLYTFEPGHTISSKNITLFVALCDYPSYALTIAR
jgi:hypothetical protein